MGCAALRRRRHGTGQADSLIFQKVVPSAASAAEQTYASPSGLIESSAGSGRASRASSSSCRSGSGGRASQASSPSCPVDRFVSEDSVTDEPSSSDDDDEGCSPEEMWQRQAQRLQKQERRRRRAARAAKRSSKRAHSDKGRQASDRNFDLLYTIGQRLGRGAYSTVSLCTHTATGSERALKSIDRKKAPSPEHITEEIAVLKLLGGMGHSNIICLHETFEDAKAVHLVLDYCSGGELFTQISSSAQNGFDEKIAASISRQLISAILFMHTKRVAHRDVKPENFMLRERQDISQATIKAIDFGLSKRFVPGVYMTTTACTPCYVAPEVLTNRYTEACDMWSLGVLIFLLLCGALPFDGNDNAQVLEAVKSGKYSFNRPPWQIISECAKRLVARLLLVDASRRATAQQTFEDPWIHNSTTSLVSQGSCASLV